MPNIALLMSPGGSVSLFVTSCVITSIAPLAIFNYGYCHYVHRCRSFLGQHFPTYARYVAKMPLGWHGYAPHALATVTLFLFIGLRAPVVYDYVNVYQVTSFAVVLACVIVDAVYMLCWVVLWLAFTVKQEWNFRVNPLTDLLNSLQRPSPPAAASVAVVATQHSPAQTAQARHDHDDAAGFNLATQDGSKRETTSGSAAPMTSQPQQRSATTLQLADRPPPYDRNETLVSSANPSDTRANVANTTNPAQTSRVMTKAAHLPPLHIDTSSGNASQSSVSDVTVPRYSQQAPASISPRYVTNAEATSRAARRVSPRRAQKQKEEQRATSGSNLHSQQRVSVQASRARHPPSLLHTPPRRTELPSHDSTDSVFQATPADVTATSPTTSALKKSGLRKSGERRHNVAARVTFDESVQRLDDEPVTSPILSANGGKAVASRDFLQLSPNSLLHYRRLLLNEGAKSLQNGGSVDSNIRTTTIPLNDLATSDVHVFTASTPNHVYATAASGAAGATGSVGTPENTLTRNYRSNVRDKCGQYYKHIGDVSLPPAAQSSPLTSLADGGVADVTHKRAPAAHHARMTSEAELSGIYDAAMRQTRAKSGRRLFDDQRTFSYPQQQQRDDVIDAISSGALAPTTSAVRDAMRKSTSEDDVMASLRPEERRRVTKARNQQQVRGQSANDVIARDFSASSRAAQAHARELSRELARDLIAKSRLTQNASNLPARSTMQQQPRQQQSVLLHQNNSSGSLSFRPGQTSGSKPDLSHRDSALPSSNETSSNDSSDHVLCSQV